MPLPSVSLWDAAHANAFRVPGTEWYMPLAPARIIAIIVFSIVLRMVLHALINGVVRRAIAGLPNPLRPLPRKLRNRLRAMAPDPNSARREQRLAAVGSVLRSVVTTVVVVVALVATLSELGINITGVVTVSSVLGVALGFGAQTLVRDYLNGLAMLVEDQYGVGDTVDVGMATGVVEDVGLRVTRLRDIDGIIWHVRNGEILRVANKSQGAGRAVVDVPVAYAADMGRVRAILEEAVHAAAQDPAIADALLEPPVVSGVERFDENRFAVRVVAQTQPTRQDDVARFLREAAVSALGAAGIGAPYATVSGPVDAAPDPAA